MQMNFFGDQLCIGDGNHNLIKKSWEKDFHMNLQDNLKVMKTIFLYL